MAKETKFIEVHPSDAESTVEVWQSFGWELMGSQEIYNKTVHDGDSRIDLDGNVRTKVITSVVNYTKITFQREKSMKNYDELVALEKKYHSMSPTYPPEPTRFSVKLIILSIVGLFIFVVPGLIFIIMSVVKFATYPGKHESWKKSVERYQLETKAKEAVLEQAKTLV